MIRSVVVFPAPFAPRSAVIEPLWAVKETSSTATMLPNALWMP
jgi:hypothetical protein